MMTAMDVANLPPALVRSGRIDLWLEMRYPNSVARVAILEQLLSGTPNPFCDADVERIVESTDEFTGADLKRTVEDGKALYAFDRVNELAIKESTEYFQIAAEAVRESKEKYAWAKQRANATRQTRPVWFNPYSQMDYMPDDEDE